MPYVVLFAIGALFLAIGSVVTPANARHLLSGYNTMGAEERRRFDLDAYLPAFRRFHVFLGVSFVAIGYGLAAYDESLLKPFLVAYPVAAYVGFAMYSTSFRDRGSELT